MNQIQTLATGGTIRRLTRDTALVTGTLDEIQSVLAAVDKSGRLDSHGEITPATGSGMMVNVRLRARPRMPSTAVVPVRPRASVQPARTRAGVQVAVVAAAASIAGLAAVGILMVVIHNVALLIGVGAAAAALFWLLTRVGGSGGRCSGVHVKH